jgi:hypothetical protein
VLALGCLVDDEYMIDRRRLLSELTVWLDLGLLFQLFQDFLIVVVEELVARVNSVLSLELAQVS